MTSRGNWDREGERLLKRIDIPDLSNHLDVVRHYLQELASSFSKIANRRWRNAGERTLDHGGRDLGNNEGHRTLNRGVSSCRIS